MVEHTSFLIAISLVGLLLGGLFRRRVDYVFVCFTAFPFGMLVWVLLVMAISCLGIALTTPLAVGAFGLACATLTLMNLRSTPYTRREVALFVIALLSYAVVCALAVRFNYSRVLGYDDWVMPLIGRAYVAAGGMDAQAGVGLACWGVFVPAVHSASVVLGPDVDYSYAYQPVQALCLLATFIYAARSALGRWRLRPAAAGLLLGLTLLAMGATYLVVLHVFYLHTHVNSALYLLLFFVALWQGLRQARGAWLVYALLALIAFTLQRVEAPLFGLICLAFVLSRGELTRGQRALFALTYSWFVSLWCIKTASVIGAGANDMIAPKVSVLTASDATLLAVLFALAPACCLGRSKLAERARRALPLTALYVLAGALCLFVILRTKHMAACLRFMAYNGFDIHYWGATTIVLVVLMVVATMLKRSFPHEDLFGRAIPAFVMLTYGLGFFLPRPWRLGRLDSANRMLMHYVPIAFLYLLLKFGAACSPPRGPGEETPCCRVKCAGNPGSGGL